MSGPIKTAIIGFGTSGRVFHAPFISADPDFELSVIVTADPGRQTAARAAYPDATIVASADELWEHPDRLDLVVIGTPSRTHADLAARALEAGVHTVVDKPFALTAASARELITQAQRVGRLVVPFQNRRWDADFLTLRRLLEAGELGDVHRFESRFEWWKPEQARSWKTEAAHTDGGGLLYDLGSHLIDQAIQLFGRVRDVYAEVEQRREFVAANDDVFLALRHENGVSSHLWMNAVAPAPGPRFHVLGSRAAFTSWGLDGQEAALVGGARPTDERFGVVPSARYGHVRTGEDDRAVATERGDYGAFYRLLARSILEAAPVPVDPRDVVHVLEVIERTSASSADES